MVLASFTGWSGCSTGLIISHRDRKAEYLGHCDILMGQFSVKFAPTSQNDPGSILFLLLFVVVVVCALNPCLKAWNKASILNDTPVPLVTHHHLNQWCKKFLHQFHSVQQGISRNTCHLSWLNGSVCVVCASVHISMCECGGDSSFKFGPYLSMCETHGNWWTVCLTALPFNQLAGMFVWGDPSGRWEALLWCVEQYSSPHSEYKWRLNDDPC